MNLITSIMISIRMCHLHSYSSARGGRDRCALAIIQGLLPSAHDSQAPHSPPTVRKTPHPSGSPSDTAPDPTPGEGLGGSGSHHLPLAEDTHHKVLTGIRGVG